MNATIKTKNYITGIEKLPLSHQLEAINKQIRHFAALSKRKDLTVNGKISLLSAWESVETLKSQVLTKMIAIKSTFSLN